MHGPAYLPPVGLQPMSWVRGRFCTVGGTPAGCYSCCQRTEPAGAQIIARWFRSSQIAYREFAARDSPETAREPGAFVAYGGNSGGTATSSGRAGNHDHLASTPVSVSALSARSARSLDETRAIRSRKVTRQLKKLPQSERDKFFSELQKTGKADVYHYSAMLSHAADSAQADELLDQMSEAGVQPNVVTYNTLINKHQGNGQLDRARALLDSMAASGVRPDVVTYSSLIDGLRFTSATSSSCT